MTASEIIQPRSQQIMTIVTGTYFGDCFGYCNDSMTITPDKIHFVRTSNVPDDSFPELSGEIDINSDTWAELIDSTDIEKFKRLPRTIGCPDCYDQGGEWIEITSGEVTYRVDIEFGASIPEIDDLLVKLRELRESLTKRYN